MLPKAWNELAGRLLFHAQTISLKAIIRLTGDGVAHSEIFSEANPKLLGRTVSRLDAGLFRAVFAERCNIFTEDYREMK